jgi:protein-disulfide isomerase
MRSWVVTLALVLVATVVAPARADRDSFDPKVVYKIPRGPQTATEGPASAPVTIVVWSDYACGYCNRVQGTLGKLDHLYPGQIRWVHRTLPLDEDYTLAAEASLAAAAQGRFRPMHERLFALRGRVTRAEAELVARELGLDMIRFRADLDVGTYRDVVARDSADAEQLGITGTPTFFVNGRPVHGNQPLRVFAEVVDQELARADAVRAKHPAELYDALVADGRARADTPDAEHEDSELDPGVGYRVGTGLPGHQLGPDDAPVTLIEWSDFECPYCAKSAPVIAGVRKKYGDAVRIVFRHDPMPFHRNAQLAAEAGVAASEQGKFWQYQDQIWDHAGNLSRADLEQYAAAVGLDMAKFRTALDEHRHRNVVLAEAAAAEALGVAGTPTMFINGQPVVGSHSQEDLDRIIDAHLANAKSALAHGVAKGELYPMIMSTARGTDRADPSTVPQSTLVHIELRADDRGRAVAAACRRRDPARARDLARGLDGDTRRRAFLVCAGEGIDL